MAGETVIELFLADEAATQHLGERLAASLPDCATIYLYGDLGAGKSTLARAMLRALGVTGPIKSPTYTLLESYPSEQGELAHLDLYRIGDPEELGYLGLDELHATARLWLIEWPERGQGGLPACDLAIRIFDVGLARKMLLTAYTPTGLAWLGSLEADD